MQRDASVEDILNQVFPGDSDCSHVCRQIDWTVSPLGPVHTWPENLRTCVSIMMQCTIPMCVYATPKQICVHNDAASKIFSRPNIGRSAWDTYGQTLWAPYAEWIEQVLATGKSLHLDNQRVYSHLPDGRILERYFLLSLSPIGVDSNSRCGVLVAMVDMTDSVVTKRRLQFRTAFASQLSRTRSIDEFHQSTFHMFASHQVDLPYAMLFCRTQNKISICTGLNEDHPLRDEIDAENPWLCCIRSRPSSSWTNCSLEVVELTGKYEQKLWDGLLCKQLVVVPVMQTPYVKGALPEPSAFLAFGLNPSRPFDEQYRDFCRLLADSISAAVFHIEAVTLERVHAEEFVNEERRLRMDLEQEVQHRTALLQEANVCLMREIEEKKKTELKLQESERRYRVLADASPVTIAVADASGRYVFVNPAGCALCEMSAEEIYAGKSLELLHPEDRDRVLTRWAEYLAGSLPFETIHDTYRIVTPSGKMRWTLTQVTADVEEGTGRVLGFIIVSTDISEQKAAEEAKLAALESAEKAQRARASEAEMNKRNLQNFIDTICHETRNPLSGAMLTLELQVDMVTRLQEMVDSDNVLDRASLSSLLMEFADSVESLRLCVEHQRNVFNQVIELSRIESGKLLLQPTLFVVQDALEEVHQMHEAVCAKKRLQFRYSACADRIVVCADNIRFKQILINLVANAVKYTPVGGTIDLIMREPGVDALVFDVHDSGPGFTDSEREQLFHRFSQISRSKGDSLNSWNILHDNSAGLGLSICKVLIEMLQGSIDVTSQPGCGSTFSIRLPWKYERKAGIQYVPERYSVVGTRRYSAECSSCPPSKVLIVDDNTIASKALQRMLTRRGHAVEVAANGLDGVKSYEVFRPDVIFMDIEMPLMDGLEASRRIRNLEKEGGWPHVPIFAVSGYTRDETQNEAFAAGMNGYVPKPFRPADLDSIIARVRATT